MCLIERAQTGDRDARNKLVEENTGLVHHIVKRFQGRGYDREDLFQIGCIGLIKAIDHFDASYDVKLSTYAVPMITGEIKRFLRDDGMIKVSRSIKENGWKIKRATDRLTQEYGRMATVEEIAAATELSVEEIVLALEAVVEVDSIDRTIYEGEGKEISMIDRIVKPKDCSIGQVAGVKEGGFLSEAGHGIIDIEKEQLLNRMLLEQLLDSLDGKEREMIECRYFQNMTQNQVAKRLNMSQVQVSRMEKKILVTMRKRAGLTE